MKLLNSVLYIEFAEMVECGVSDLYLRKAKSTGTKCWSFMEDPDDKRKVLIEYESLKDNYKELIKKRFGSPYEFLAKMPIRNLVKMDSNAEEFYLAYRYDENKPLPIDHVKKYAKAASWLNMIKEVNEDKRALKKLLNLTIDQFYKHLLDIIKIDKIDLPTSYRRLLATRKEYEEKGYASLIDWRFGNKLAAKINDEVSESVLGSMIENGNQFDDVFIAGQYNLWAASAGYKLIEPATVGVHRRRKNYEYIMSREGNEALNEKYLIQVKGFRPSAPLYMVESDDNHLDLLFIDPNDDSSSKYYHRYKAIVVMDSYNDYVLGYAYSENLSIELVHAAYLNAMYHIRSITGGWHLPHEIKTDRWSLSSLQPFYESIGKYFPTPTGSKHRGYIEPFFGSHHWKRCLKIGANNYSGNNITAKHRGVNMKMLENNKKNRPLIGNEADLQVENFFHRLRYMKQTDGTTKQENWLAAWSALSEKNKRPISDEQFLLKFGVKHLPKSRETGRISNRGIEPIINGIEYSYNIDAESIMEFIGKQVTVIYDPYDMSRVLVTDFEKVRLMAYDAKRNSRALSDSTEGSRAFLNAVISEKENDVEYISKKMDRRKEVLKTHKIDAETLLQAGVMVKEMKQTAEQKVLVEATRAYDDNDDFFNQL